MENPKTISVYAVKPPSSASSLDIAEESRKDFTMMKISDISSTSNLRKDLGDIEGLARSVEECGLLHPLVVQRETKELIVGHRRLEALKKLGREIVPVHFVSINDVLRAQLDENRARKDFSFEEEMKIADILEPVLKKEAEERMVAVLMKGTEGRNAVTEKFGNGTKEDKHKRSTAGQLSAYFGESDRQFEIKRAIWKRVARAPVDEREKIIGSIDGGEPVKKLLGHLNREARISEYAKLAEKIKLSSSDIQLFNGDFTKVLKELKDESVDAIVSDIPYSKKDIPLCKDLAKLAERVLKSNSPMLIMVGQCHLPEVCSLVSANSSNMNYLWTLAELNLSNTRNLRKREGVLVCWKPILWYVKGKNTALSGTDIIVKGPPEKEFWEQQQSVPTFEELIRRVTKPGDLVLDPFLGTGTTGVASVRLKRRFIGSEIDPTRFLVAKKRIEEELDKSN